MSITGAGTLDGGLLGRLTARSQSVRAQLDTALVQESTGRIAEDYAGLGVGARTSLDLGPTVIHLQTWQSNIDLATNRLSVTQTVMSSISEIATNFLAQTNNVNTIGYSEADSIAANAKQALQQVAQLLNTRVGNVYLFSGSDSSNPPIPNTDPTAIAADIQASNSGPPFSATIGAVPTVEIGEGQRVQIGLLANQDTLVSSSGSPTGSYMRDILLGLTTLAGMTAGAGAVASAATARTQLQAGSSALSDEQGALGNIQAGLKTTQSMLASTQTALKAQVSDAQDVDMAETITRIQALQTQLQASYQLIAGVKSLSLVNFLPAGG
jgi:flagellar hook-associated protein 3 FlgL